MHSELQEKLEQLSLGGFEKLRIAIVGDLMLDHYVFGTVRRISPEAPVPVIEFDKDSNLLGGAGNVARNLRSLGVRTALFSVVGKDRYGELLLEMSNANDIDTAGIFASDRRLTTVKMRILSGTKQQILRLDYEKKQQLETDDQISVVNNFRDFLESGVDAVVISDYGKGFCSESLCGEIIALCRLKGVKVFVDPKGKAWEKYSGAFIITPNLKELSEVVGADVPNQDDEIVAAANEVLRRFDLENILVTRSEQGATLVDKEKVFHQKCSEKEVYDVSGAGDTMISTLAAFVAGGASLHDSIFAANAAAQVVIQKAGTASVTTKELLVAVDRELAALEGGQPFVRRRKLLTWEEAAFLCKQWKGQGERVIFTNGCFDILHAGHIDSIRAARALGEHLIIGVNGDDSVRRLKGAGRPFNNAAARAKMLGALQDVDAVVIFDEDTPAELLSKLCPNVIVKGGDYAHDQVAGREYADEVVIIPLTEGYSTTSILRRLEAEDKSSC